MSLQAVSLDIWSSKYQLKDKNGQVIDQDVQATFQRIAKALAAVETKDSAKWEKKFLWAMEMGATPAGRILSNAGAEEFKPSTSLINCTVSAAIEDSMSGILGGVHEAGLTLKAGCGIGYEFSTLRPKGAFVAGAGAYTSGPLSFMDIYDKMCFTVSSAGGRRGAQMATFDISHPDIMDFIKAKREDGRFRQFNLSCLITKEFMDAVNSDQVWQLVFPVSRKEIGDIEGALPNDLVWKDVGYATGKNLVKRENGEVLCRVYKTIKARRLWDVIMTSTYDFAEPGFILIDQVNELNNNWFCENIRATNPCGEQPLPPNGACLLGSINLTKFISHPFSSEASFDWAAFEKVVKIFTRMLDNVVEISGLPLEAQRNELLRKRRHGMGFYGIGSALAMMQIPYGSDLAVSFSEDVARSITLIGLEVGLELAIEKGAAPIMDETFEITAEMFAKRPEMAFDGLKIGDIVTGKLLWAKYSRFMQRLATHDEKANSILKKLAETGSRFTHHSSIAPTGTMALSVGNNASNGIEPSFSHSYFRNVIREGKKTKEKVEVMSYEFYLYRQLVDTKATTATLPTYFVDAATVTPTQHVDMQAAAQYWIDSAISKTINVPTDIAFDDFKSIYQYAYEKGLKGCTTFRFNPEAFQGVLVTEKDLASTIYQFKLDDGSVVELNGNEEIEYDGEIHTAANLYDALKEGYYGKF